MTADSPYFKFPSVQKTSEVVQTSSDLASSQEEEIEKVAYEFSLRVIHECINELNNEIVIMNDLEEKAKELFTQTIRSSTEDICGGATEQSAISNQSTLYTGFVSSSIEGRDPRTNPSMRASSVRGQRRTELNTGLDVRVSLIEGTTPDRNDYISKWMEDQAQITNYDDLNPVSGCEDKHEDTYSPEDAQKSSSYDSSDDEEDRVITLNKNMYGSFDETKRPETGPFGHGQSGHTPQDPSPRVSEWQGKSLDQSEASAGSRPEVGHEDALNSKINKLIIDIVSDAVCELQSECRFESDLSRKTADVVLEILAEAIQIGREPQVGFHCTLD